MNTLTVLLIIIAGIVATGLSVFQYYSRKKKLSRFNLILAFLRFLCWFGLFILLINPQFKQLSYEKEKASLIIAVDNSESIDFLEQTETTKEILNDLLNNEELSERFNMVPYTITNDFEELDSLNFAGKQSNISGALETIKKIYANSVAPVVLLSDGNQTFGEDYEFSSKRFKQQVFPVVLGDTLPYKDLSIPRININKYAFLKNQFPVEIFTQFSGDENTNSLFTIKQGNRTLFSKNLSFDKDIKSHIVSVNLDASSVGIQKYTAFLNPISGELNKTNNAKSFGIEVVDERTNVLIVTNISHPDVGALKKSIESNQQRSVSVLKTNEIDKNLDEYHLVIAYQPTSAFKVLFNTIEEQSKNVFIITGTQTDWQFLNNIQSDFVKERNFQTEDFQSVFNNSFASFQVESSGLENLPPLKGYMGDIIINTTHNVLFNKKVQNIETQEPLWVSINSESNRKIVLFGENIWKWRMQSYLSEKTFEDFDSLIGKCIFYLASGKERQRLTVDYDSFYYGDNNIKISASFFDTNYVFDSNNELLITVKNTTTKETQQFPMLLKNNYYQVDLDNLNPGEYDFTVRVSDKNFSNSGRFSILDFDVEKQFVNANFNKLKMLAENTGGTTFSSDEVNLLVKKLLEDNRFIPIQKSLEKSVSLIDWKYLLFAIAFFLALEWFLRKYNGLI